MAQVRWLLASALLVACVLTAQMALGRKKEKSGAMDGQKRALHALNRLTFGPRPGGRGPRGADGRRSVD